MDKSSTYIFDLAKKLSTLRQPCGSSSTRFKANGQNEIKQTLWLVPRIFKEKFLHKSIATKEKKRNFEQGFLFSRQRPIRKEQKEL
jgi:hypothetical protein